MHRIRMNPFMVLMAAMGVVVVSIGIRQTFGLYLRPMSEAFGWGREVFAFAIAIQNLMWGVFQPAAGAITDKYGAGRVLAFGSIAYFLGILGMATATTPLYLTVSVGLLVGLGLSATGFAVVLGAVSRGAPAGKRGMYLGIVSAGGSIGQFIMLPTGQWLISSQGWSQALIVTGLLALIGLPLAFALSGRPTQAPTGKTVPVLALAQAAREMRFWLLVAGFFVCGFHVAFIGTHLPAYLTDNGISPQIAALALSMVGLFNIFGSFTFGLMGDRFSKKYTLCLIYLGRSVIIGLFILFPITPFTVIAFGAGMGFLWLGTVPLTSGLVGQMFGTRYMGILFGVVFMGHQLGSFTGVWLGGLVFDATGSYDLVWWGAIALGVFSALVHWPIKEGYETDLEWVGSPVPERA